MVAIEVLSPTTRNFDREDKLEEYKSVPTLRHIVLIDPDVPSARHYRRTDDADWTVDPVDGLDGMIELSALDATLRFTDVYDGVAFKPRPRLVKVED